MWIAWVNGDAIYSWSQRHSIHSAAICSHIIWESLLFIISPVLILIISQISLLQEHAVQHNLPKCAGAPKRRTSCVLPLLPVSKIKQTTPLTVSSLLPTALAHHLSNAESHSWTRQSLSSLAWAFPPFLSPPFLFLPLSFPLYAVTTTRNHQRTTTYQPPKSSKKNSTNTTAQEAASPPSVWTPRMWPLPLQQAHTRVLLLRLPLASRVRARRLLLQRFRGVFVQLELLLLVLRQRWPQRDRGQEWTVDAAVEGLGRQLHLHLSIRIRARTNLRQKLLSLCWRGSRLRIHRREQWSRFRSPFPQTLRAFSPILTRTLVLVLVLDSSTRLLRGSKHLLSLLMKKKRKGLSREGIPGISRLRKRRRMLVAVRWLIAREHAVESPAASTALGNGIIVLTRCFLDLMMTLRTRCIRLLQI